MLTRFLVLLIQMTAVSTTVQLQLDDFTFSTLQPFQNYTGSTGWVLFSLTVTLQTTSAVESLSTLIPFSSTVTEQSVDGFAPMFMVDNETSLFAIAATVSLKTLDSSNGQSAQASLYTSTPLIWNGTDNVLLSTTFNNNEWTLTGNLTRQCVQSNTFGFNCDVICNDVNDTQQCYTCDFNGDKVCCDDTSVNPDCMLLTTVTSVTEMTTSAQSTVSVSATTETSVSMGTETSVSMGTETSVSMVTESSVSMATETSVSMGTETSVSMVTETSVSMVTESSVSMGTESSVSMGTATSTIATTTSPSTITGSVPTGTQPSITTTPRPNAERPNASAKLSTGFYLFAFSFVTILRTAF